MQSSFQLRTFMSSAPHSFSHYQSGFFSGPLPFAPPRVLPLRSQRDRLSSAPAHILKRPPVQEVAVGFFAIPCRTIWLSGRRLPTGTSGTASCIMRLLVFSPVLTFCGTALTSFGGDFNMRAFSTDDVFTDLEFAAPDAHLWEQWRPRSCPQRPYTWRVHKHGCYMLDNRRPQVRAT